jgi:hypothetical protein
VKCGPGAEAGHVLQKRGRVPGGRRLATVGTASRPATDGASTDARRAARFRFGGGSNRQIVSAKKLSVRRLPASADQPGLGHRSAAARCSIASLRAPDRLEVEVADQAARRAGTPSEVATASAARSKHRLRSGLARRVATPGDRGRSAHHSSYGSVRVGRRRRADLASPALGPHARTPRMPLRARRAIEHEQTAMRARPASDGRDSDEETVLAPRVARHAGTR